METTAFNEVLSIVSKKGLTVRTELDEGDNYINFEEIITSESSDFTVYAKGGAEVNIKTDDGDYYTAPCVAMTVTDFYLENMAILDGNGEEVVLTSEQDGAMRKTIKHVFDVLLY